MLKAILAAASILLASCTPPPEPPPPRFRPNPPYPPEMVDPYGQPQDTTYSEPAPTPPTPPTPPDVQGFRSGQLARDPSNNQIFRVP